MKRIVMALWIIPVCLWARSPSAEERDYYYATTRGADVLDYVRVIDQDGKPVSEAKLYGALTTGDGMKDYTPIDAFTDTNGEFVIKGKCTDFLSLRVTKNNYYKTSYKHTYRSTTLKPRIVDGKWQPYGNHHTIVLNKIINPQPLKYHNSLTSFKIPVYNEWLGFDIEKYDFTVPYGKGVEKDMLLRFVLKNPSFRDYHMTMEVSFTNNPYAGAYEMTKNSSELKSVYHADTNATYRQMLLYRFDDFPNKVPDYSKCLLADKYLVFRTRTKTDAEGRLVSAHYGKIYVEWNFIGEDGMRIQQVVFNQTANDTNLEDLHSAERSRRMRESLEMRPGEKRKHMDGNPFKLLKRRSIH